MGKRYTPFASSADGKLFVKVEAIMHPLCAVYDGLTLVFFDKEKTAYLPLEAAIAWCERELQHSRAGKYRVMIHVMKKFEALEKGATP